MMDCDRAKQLLSAGMDDPGCRGHDEALRHADDCAGCDRFRTALESLCAMPAPSAPDGFTERLMARLETLDIAENDRADDLRIADEAPVQRHRVRNGLTQAVPWLATAAVILLAVGVGASVSDSYYTTRPELRKGPSRYAPTGGGEPEALSARTEEGATRDAGGSDGVASAGRDTAAGPGATGDAEVKNGYAPTSSQKAVSAGPCPKANTGRPCVECHGSGATWEMRTRRLPVQDEGYYDKASSQRAVAAATASRSSMSVVVFQGRVYVPKGASGTSLDRSRPDRLSGTTYGVTFDAPRHRHPVRVEDVPELRGFERPRFMGIDEYGRAVFVSDAVPLEIVTFDHHEHLFKRWRTTP